LILTYYPLRVTTLDQVGSDEQVREVSLGRVHTAALTHSNEIYTWGCGHKGRLGHGGTDDEEQPRLVEEFDGGWCDLVTVQCGLDHTLVMVHE